MVVQPFIADVLPFDTLRLQVYHPVRALVERIEVVLRLAGRACQIGLFVQLYVEILDGFYRYGDHYGVRGGRSQVHYRRVQTRDL